MCAVFRLRRDTTPSLIVNKKKIMSHSFHTPRSVISAPKPCRFAPIAVAVAAVLAAASLPAFAAETIVIRNILVTPNDSPANYYDHDNDYQLGFNGSLMNPASISVESNQLIAELNSLTISDSGVNFKWPSNYLIGITGTAKSTVDIRAKNNIEFKSYDSNAKNLFGLFGANSTIDLKSKEGSVIINLSKEKDDQPGNYTGNDNDPYDYGRPAIIHTENSSQIRVEAAKEISLKFTSTRPDQEFYGIDNDNSNITLSAGEKLEISVKGNSDDRVASITSIKSSNTQKGNTQKGVSLQVQGNTDNLNNPVINISAEGSGYPSVIAVKAENSNFRASASNGDISISANNANQGVAYALNLKGSVDSELTADNGNIMISSSVGKHSTSSGDSLGAWLTDSSLTLKGKTIEFDTSNNSTNDGARSYSILSSGSDGNMTIEEGSENLTINTFSLSNNSYSIYNNGSTIDLHLSNYVEINTDGYGIYSGIAGVTKVSAGSEVSSGSVVINADRYGIYSANAGRTTVSAGSVEINAGTITHEGFGDGIALLSSNTQLSSNKAITTLLAAHGNTFRGIVGANQNASVSISTVEGTNVFNAYGNRAEYSATNLPSAVYATEGGEVTIDAGDGLNRIQAEFNTRDGNPAANDIERAVWARSGGSITINGRTIVAASHAALDENGNVVDETHLSNALGVALAAGYVEEDLLESGELPTPESLSTINLNYQGSSQIVGDVVSAYSGDLNVSPQPEGGTLLLYGNALAGNGGKLNVNLGENGVWIGRSDDYGDAGLPSLDDNGHQNFFSPVFSHSIVQGGQVNVTMGSNSVWRVNGQSWLTTLQTADNAENVVVDMVSANTDRNQSAHALTLYKLSGDVTFSMSLDGNRDVSDMLYIKHAEGDVNIDVVDSVSTEDMFQEGFDGLRFATVGKGSTASFRAYTLHEGALNVEYQVEAEAYDAAAVDENNAYNGTALDTEKPGSDNVDQFFGYEENTGIVTADAALNDAQTEETPGVQDTTNYKLVGRKGETLSDAGQTIFATARATYWNAVVLDRWNQRYGERTYDQNRSGVWARVKHERLGTDAGVGDFRSYNTMYQFGYDYTKPTQNGRMIWGGAIDYMDGRTDYKSIEGDGGTDRTELSLYATYLADSGFYGDLVVRAGRLSSDFEMYTAKGVKLDVDYDNWLYGLSFETGRQLTNNSGWFVEPQLQAQYIRITSGDYTTQQNTRVEQDDIDSLIGRAGFRIGKFLANDKSSVGYFKADVLREFMGEQRIHLTDKTTPRGGQDFCISNHGTWFDVGAGFQAGVTDDLYAFGDVEYRFGNDLERTWIFNIGAKYRF